MKKQALLIVGDKKKGIIRANRSFVRFVRYAQKLKDKLRESLPYQDNGSISLIARAWAVKGTAIP